MTSRIVFMGSCPFALRILQRVMQDFPICGVFTAPPRPKGRGYTVQRTCVHDYAQSKGIEVYTPTTFKDPQALADLRDLEPTIAIVASYGLLLPQSVLDIPKAGCINVHPSILPRWRGASPLVYPILMGEKETGVAIMVMDAGMDTGPILHQGYIPIAPRTTTESLSQQLSVLGGNALCAVLPLYLAGEIQAVSQEAEGLRLAPKIQKEMGYLDWSLPAWALLRKIDALQPWPGTWGFFGHDTLAILGADCADYEGTESPGKVILWEKSWAVVCGQKTVLIPKQVRSPHGKVIDAAMFMRGYRSLLGV